jgi:DnaJ-domain-containing protein 1
MAWTGKLVGGLLGGMLGGPVGAGVGAALGHVLGDKGRALELARLDWQHHAFRACGPGVELVPVWTARGLAGDDVSVRLRVGEVDERKVVVPEEALESCALPRFFVPYAALPGAASVVAKLRLRGPRGHGDDADFELRLPSAVRRLGNNGPARAVMALVGAARAGGRSLGRDDVRFVRESFCEGIPLDDDGIQWLRAWLRELRDAEPTRLAPEKVARRLEPHLDDDARARLVGWSWRAVSEAWPGAPHEAYVRALAAALGTSEAAPGQGSNAEALAEARALLGVAPGADAAALREAWLRLLHRWHPDHAPSPAELPEHNRRTAEINAAYRLLAPA